MEYIHCSICKNLYSADSLAVYRKNKKICVKCKENKLAEAANRADARAYKAWRENDPKLEKFKEKAEATDQTWRKYTDRI